MPTKIRGQIYFRTTEVCRMVGISKNTLYRWLNHGILGESERRDRRGWRIFTQEEVDELKAETGRITILSQLR